MYFTISELSRHSSIPVSTIKFYLSKKFFHPPIKISKTTAFYTSEHLEKLRLIKKLRREKKLSFELIKKILEKMEDSDGKNQVGLPDKLLAPRDAIIEATIKLFRKKGYSKTTIRDIASVAHISKTTFYAHFKDKKKLFINCLEKIFNETQPPSTYDHFESEKSLTRIMKKRTLAFYKNYPRWSDMMNLLRGVAVSNPKDFKKKLDDAMLVVIDHVAKRMARGTREGVVRDIDSIFIGVVILGILDYCCHFFYRGILKGSQASLIDKIVDVTLNGIKEPNCPK